MTFLYDNNMNKKKRCNFWSMFKMYFPIQYRTMFTIFCAETLNLDIHLYIEFKQFYVLLTSEICEYILVHSWLIKTEKNSIWSRILTFYQDTSTHRRMKILSYFKIIKDENFQISKQQNCFKNQNCKHMFLFWKEIFWPP